jgi:hypothetical protein
MWNRSIRAVRLAAAVASLALFAGAHSAFADQTGVRAAATGTDSDVYALTAAPDGTTSLTIYRPAPGVTSADLSATLAAQGVNGIVTPSAAAAAALPCSLGTARTLVCPPVKWARNGFAHPQVYFLDHTSSAWPLTAVVPNWNLAHGVDSWYRWFTAGCPGGGRHCVNVYDANYGGTGWTGLSHFSWNSSNNFIDGSVYTQLNDFYGGTAAEHRNTTCHELGHDLGLAHNVSTSSCLYFVRTSQQTPNADDFNMLAAIYP